MQIPRMIGIIIIFGAPAIVFGGLAYDLFESWLAVIGMEVLVVLGAFTTAYNACK